MHAAAAHVRETAGRPSRRKRDFGRHYTCVSGRRKGRTAPRPLQTNPCIACERCATVRSHLADCEGSRRRSQQSAILLQYKCRSLQLACARRWSHRDLYAGTWPPRGCCLQGLRTRLFVGVPEILRRRCNHACAHLARYLRDIHDTLGALQRSANTETYLIIQRRCAATSQTALCLSATPRYAGDDTGSNDASGSISVLKRAPVSIAGT